MAGQHDTKTADWPAVDSAVPGTGEVSITRPALGETWHGTITSSADGMAQVRVHSYTPRGGGPKRRMRHHVTVPVADLEHARRRVAIRRVTPEGKALWAEARHRRVHGRFADTGTAGFAEMHGFASRAGIPEARAAWDRHQWRPQGKPKDVSQITAGMYKTRLSLLDDIPAEHKEAYGAAAFHLKAAETRMLDRGMQAGQIDQDKMGQAYHRMAEAHQRIAGDVLPHAQPGHYPEAAKHLQRIAGHMQDLDRLMGANPALTRLTVGGFDEVFAHAGEARAPAGGRKALQVKTVTVRAWDEGRHRRGWHGEFGDTGHAGHAGPGGFRAMRGFALPWDQDGDVLHYHGSLGVDRAGMPQISGVVAGRYAPSSEMIPKFLAHLKAGNIEVTRERVPAGSLKPTQATGDAGAVRGIADRIAAGKDTKPVLVSADNRVIDGHHQWAAHVLAESQGTSTAGGVPVIRVHLPARAVLEQARQFAAGQGIAGRATGVAADPKYAKDQRTKSITGGGDMVAAARRRMPDGSVVLIESKGLFSETAHPRDRHGQWIDVGHEVHLADGSAGKITGIEAGGKVAVSVGGKRKVVAANEVSVRAPTADTGRAAGAAAKPAAGGFRQMHAPLTDTEYQAHTQAIQGRLQGALDAGMATDHAHTMDPAHTVWTPERAAIHKDIVDKMLAGAKDVPDEGKGIIAGGLGGAGKALWIDTEIPTPRGWTTMGKLAVGDMVFGADGMPCRVIATTEVMHDEQCYQLTFSDGTVVTADADHLWSVVGLKARRPLNSGAVKPLQRITSRVYSVNYPDDLGMLTAADESSSIADMARRIGVSRGSLRDYLACRPELAAAVRPRLNLPAEGDRRFRHPSPGTGEWGSGLPKVLSTAEIAGTWQYVAPGGKTETNYSIPVASPAEYPRADLPVPPYLLGAWLGDGACEMPRITGIDDEVRQRIEADGWPAIPLRYPSMTCPAFKVFAPGDLLPPSGSMGEVSAERRYYSQLPRRLRQLGVYGKGNKHIPERYLTASVDDRRALLAGLLDTDGTVDNRAGRRVTFGHVVSRRLADDVRELVSSLGMKASISDRTTNGRPYWAVSFAPERIVFGLTRKARRQRPRTGDAANNERRVGQRYIVDVKRTDSVPVRCIVVDAPDGLFLITRSYLPTHNSTVLARHAGVDTSQYMTINPDDIKEEMARRGLVPKVEGLSPMESAALVHEESSRIGNMAAQRAYAQRKNVIWDITMSSAKSADKRIGDMRGAGYQDVRGVFVDIPGATSVDRAMARHRRGLEDYRQGKGYGGRYVPPEIIRQSAGSGPVSTNRAAFEQLHGKFDGWSMYDNSVHGRAPVHMASGGTSA